MNNSRSSRLFQSNNNLLLWYTHKLSNIHIYTQKNEPHTHPHLVVVCDWLMKVRDVEWDDYAIKNWRLCCLKREDWTSCRMYLSKAIWRKSKWKRTMKETWRPLFTLIFDDLLSYITSISIFYRWKSFFCSLRAYVLVKMWL